MRHIGRFFALSIAFSLCLLGPNTFAQSSLPLAAGKVLVDRIDLASNKKIRLPEGRWIVMGLHTREIPLTGGLRTTQTTESVSLMNEDQAAPIQYLSMSWTLYAKVNWTSQPCDNQDDVKSRPLKDTLNTNISTLVIKCSASTFFNNAGALNSPQRFATADALRKSLWLPIAQNPRRKPGSLVDVYGYISKYNSDIVFWHAYINPEIYGLDQASDTQYSSPTNGRQKIADNLLKYSMAWNKKYIQDVEKDFFPTLFQSASLSTEKFTFAESAVPAPNVLNSPTAATTVPTIQGSSEQDQLRLYERLGNRLNAASSAPACAGSDATKWSNCFGEKRFTNGAIYIGEFQSGALEGTGVGFSSNGDRYVGEFRAGLPNGYGVGFALAENKWKGDVYIGDFKDRKFHGRGTYFHLADNEFKGDRHVGEFKDNIRSGQGIYYGPTGAVKSSGVWDGFRLVSSHALGAGQLPFERSYHTQLVSDARARVQLALAARERLELEAKERSRLEAETKERERLQAEVDVERKRRQELEAQLAAAQSTAQQIPSAGTTSIRSAHALVIGNAAYPGSGRLDNPVNDAIAISLKLRSMGFTVTTVTDANRQRLVQAMTQFRRSAASADLSLLFYSGHGVQIFGNNYILPTDVDQTDTAQATIQGVRLNEVIENHMPGKTKIVFLDACRDNPLQRTGDRSVTKGLAPISVSEGTLISYATKDGQVAADGVGSKNSPFTQALLEHLADPLDIGVVLRKVREKVMRATGGKQQPWDYGSLTGGELVLSRIKGGRR